MNNYIVDDMHNTELVDTFQLCYFDPPFLTQRHFGEFSDEWESVGEYIEFIRKSLIKIDKHLKGVIVVHCDTSASHHIRLLLESIFPYFINEIIWKTNGNTRTTTRLQKAHDNLLVFANVKKHTFNQIYFPYDDEYRKSNTIKIDGRGEYVTTAAYNNQPNMIVRKNMRYEWNGHNKQWWIERDRMENLHIQDRLEYNVKGIPRIKRYLHEMKGIPLRDTWNDIPSIQSGEKEDYPTQKPIKLLKRIITLFSNKNDNVIDPMAGSGTVGIACMELGNRGFLLVDKNKRGKEIFEKRKDVLMDVVKKNDKVIDYMDHIFIK